MSMPGMTCFLCPWETRARTRDYICSPNTVQKAKKSIPEAGAKRKQAEGPIDFRPSDEKRAAHTPRRAGTTKPLLSLVSQLVLSSICYQARQQVLLGLLLLPRRAGVKDRKKKELSHLYCIGFGAEVIPSLIFSSFPCGVVQPRSSACRTQDQSPMWRGRKRRPNPDTVVSECIHLTLARERYI